MEVKGIQQIEIFKLFKKNVEIFLIAVFGLSMKNALKWVQTYGLFCRLFHLDNP